MKQLDLLAFNSLLSHSTVKPRFASDLRFVTSVATMSAQDWDETELLHVSDRSGNKGVMVVQLQSGTFVVPFELRPGIVSAATGHSQSIICDLCRTWQYGVASASITFAIGKRANVTYLCCADLGCSAHVRNKTNASHTSRAQLRENMTTDQRIARLDIRLNDLMSDLTMTPIDS